jgi:transcriptional regulator with XRE-family HTH domain
MGVRPPSLRTVAEMLLAGYTKLEVAESFGVTKQYISKVTRGKMAQTLGLA